MFLSLTMLLCMLVVPAAADGHAGPDSVTSGEAVWVAHLDVEAMLDSKLGEAMLGTLDENEHAERLEAFIEKCGFDPTEDLISITLWGRSYSPASGVAVVRAEVNRKKLLKLLDDVKNHTTFEHGEHTIHQWQQKPEHKGDDGTRFGAFHGKDITVFARTRAEIEHALAVLDGKADSQADIDEEHRVLGNAPEGAWLVGGAVDIKMPEHLPHHAAVLKKVRSAYMAMGETRGQVYFDLDLGFDSARTAKQLRQMGQGMLAMGAMHLDRLEDEDKELPHWAPLVRNTEIGGRDETISMSISMAADRIIEMAEEAAEHRHGGHGRHWKHDD
jgi:hypothetical protein